MITPDQIAQFKLDAEEAKKITGFSKEVAKMFPELSSGNISDYLSGRLKPSEKFYNGFYSLYKPSNVKSDADRIDRLIAIMESHAESIARLSKANEVLAAKIGSDSSSEVFSLRSGSGEEKLQGEGVKGSVGKSRN